jgi:nucleotidyltransferase substrate binding protein (TIGR01987 family)
MKDLFNYEGYDVNSPRTTIQQAFESGFIKDITPWIEALESRDVLSHNYDKNSARDTEALIKQTYLPMLRDVLNNLQNRRDKS